MTSQWQFTCSRWPKIGEHVTPSFVDVLGSKSLLPFELDGSQHTVSDVFALRIVEHLDVFEHVLPCFVPVSVCFSAYPLALEQIETALCSKMAKKPFEITSGPAAQHFLDRLLHWTDRYPV
jgi:hypothetical protein